MYNVREIEDYHKLLKNISIKHFYPLLMSSFSIECYKQIFNLKGLENGAKEKDRRNKRD